MLVVEFSGHLRYSACGRSIIWSRVYLKGCHASVRKISDWPPWQIFLEPPSEISHVSGNENYCNLFTFTKSSIKNFQINKYAVFLISNKSTYKGYLSLVSSWPGRGQEESSGPKINYIYIDHKHLIDLTQSWPSSFQIWPGFDLLYPDLKKENTWK